MAAPRAANITERPQPFVEMAAMAINANDRRRRDQTREIVMTLLFSKKIRALAKDDIPNRFAAKLIEDDALAVKQKLCDARRVDCTGLTNDRRITS